MFCRFSVTSRSASSSDNGSMIGVCSANRADLLNHLCTLSSSVDLPLNADFESGFGSDLEELAESVRSAVEAGVSGLSIEDRDLDGPANALYDVDRTVERIRAARSAIDRTRNAKRTAGCRTGRIRTPANTLSKSRGKIDRPGSRRRRRRSPSPKCWIRSATPAPNAPS
jgi:hypothetical protein